MRSQRLIKVSLKAEETSPCALSLPFSLLCATTMVCCVLALKLQMLFAYCLSRLAAPLHLRWAHLASQFGAEDATKELGRRIRDTLPQVLNVYPWAAVDVASLGLTLHPSKPAAPKTSVNGFRPLEGRAS